MCDQGAVLVVVEEVGAWGRIPPACRSSERISSGT